MHVSVEWDRGGERKGVGGWQNEYSWTYNPNFSTIKKSRISCVYNWYLDILHSGNFTFGKIIFFLN